VWPLLAQHDPGNGGLQQTIDTLARTPLSKIVILVAICSILRIILFGYLKKVLPHQRHGAYPVAKFFNEGLDAIVYAAVFVFMLIRPFAVQAFLIPSGSMEQTLYVNDFIVANKAIYRYTEPKVGDIIVFKPPRQALDDTQTDVDFIKRCQGVPGDIVEIREGILYRNGKPIDEPYLSSSPEKNPGDQASANGNATALGTKVRMGWDWKLVHYIGRARKDLYNQYVPVQINQHPVPGEPRVNYQAPISWLYAVGNAPDKIPPSASPAHDWKQVYQFTDEDRLYAKELEDAPPAAVPKGFVLMMGDNREYSYDGRCWGLVPREDVIGRSEFIWLPLGRWRITR
jgi:signal peptidase I